MEKTEIRLNKKITTMKRVFSKNNHLYKVFKRSFSIGLLCISALTAPAQILANWDASGLTNFGPSPWMPVSSDPNITVTGLTRSAGVLTTGTAAPDAWGGHGWTGAPGCEMSFTMTADFGRMLCIDSIEVTFLKDPSGPAYAYLEYSLNGGPFMLTHGLGFLSTAPMHFPMLIMTSFSDLQNISSGTILTIRVRPDPALGGGSNGPLYITKTIGAPSVTKGLTVFGRTPPSCAMPDPVSFAAITDNSALAYWSAVPSATGYQYAYDTSLAPPTGWTYTAGTNVMLTGLEANTQYHVYVRTICTPGDTSVYSEDVFTTQSLAGIGAERDPGNLINVYPNPLENLLTVQLSGNMINGTIIITDMSGKVHEQVNVTGNKMVLNTTKLAPGAYTIHYNGPSGYSSSLVIKI